MSARLFSTTWASLALALAMPAQAPRLLSQPEVVTDPAPGTPAAIALELAKNALASGTKSSARSALESVLLVHPFAPTALRLAIAAAEGTDARLLATLEFVAVVCDEAGVVKLDPKLRKELGPELGKDLEIATALVTARSAAVQELVKFATTVKPGPKELGTVVTLDQALVLCDELTRGMPKLRKAARKDLLQARERMATDPLPVLRELQAAIQRATAPRGKAGTSSATSTTADSGDAVELAFLASRLLAGICQQARFPDLMGPRPVLGEDLLASAREGLARAREIMLLRSAPLSIEDLEAMDANQRTEFTANHRTWLAPGRARSATGKYLIETTCGHAALLGAAKTIEMHHARLVAWNDGKDPFADRVGHVRIVPEHDDLEAEGAPYWWAGGFQSGDQTHVVLRWGNLEALGHGLTHELCHRFDAALHAFLPAWASEGRAVHAGGAYGNAEEPRFLAKHLDPGALSEAFVEGYGDRAKLEKLVAGNVPDYRDNYTAGYALWTFLATWQDRDGDSEPIYGEALERWLATVRGAGKDPVGHFTKCFADGKAGRPAGLGAFAAGFREFLKGGYDHGFARQVEWLGRYRLGAQAVLSPLLAEEPNYSWKRDRVEPYFGQDHAVAAGRLLARMGATQAAAQALLWAREVDGLSSADSQLLSGLLMTAQRPVPAAALATERGEKSALLLALFPKCAGYLDLLAGEAERVANSAPRVADVWRGERAVLAAPLGAEDLPGRPAPLRPRPLGIFGFTEAGLVGYEKRRVPGLWFASQEGDLHVGRERAREETGLLDRTALQRDAFVRSGAEFAGEYVFRTRVHLTTSYVAGAVVLGNVRRDRGARVTFSAGDFLYAIGRKGEGDKVHEVRIGTEGPWSREKFLSGARAEVTHRFSEATAAFQLEIHVRGPSLVVRIDDRIVTTYATADGSAIAGPIGIAMSQGAVRLQTPTVQSVLHGDTVGLGLDLAAPRSDGIRECRDRRVLGIPAASDGVVLVYFPSEYSKRKPPEPADLPRILEPIVKGLVSDRELRCRLVVAIPKAQEGTYGAPARAAVAALGTRAEVLTHHLLSPAEEDAVLGYVDGLGIARATMLLEPGMGVFGRVGTWARRWRSR